MAITAYAPKPYSGNKRSLVLAFDVDTTSRGVSYAIPESNEIPKVQGIAPSSAKPEPRYGITKCHVALHRGSGFAGSDNTAYGGLSPSLEPETRAKYFPVE